MAAPADVAVDRFVARPSEEPMLMLTGGALLDLLSVAATDAVPLSVAFGTGTELVCTVLRVHPMRAKWEISSGCPAAARLPRQLARVEQT